MTSVIILISISQSETQCQLIIQRIWKRFFTGSIGLRYDTFAYFLKEKQPLQTAFDNFPHQENVLDYL